MKIIAIIQARLSSSRLPAKMLMPIGNSPSLAVRVLSNVSKSKKVDKVLLATSDDSTDIPLYDHVVKNGYQAFKGDLNNVLKRFYEAAKVHTSDVVIRITGDCPCLTADWLDTAINLFLKEHKENNIDYLGYPESLPDGLDLEIFTFNALEKSYKEATTQLQKEHVTPYIWQNPHLFKQKRLATIIDGYSWLRLSVDNKDDYDFINDILKKNNIDSYKELFIIVETNKIKFADHSLKVVKNEGFYKSLGSSIPKLHLGLAGVGQAYGLNKNNNKEAEYFYNLFYSSLSNGVNTWDTAPVYGDSEKIIGKFILESGFKPNIYTKILYSTDLKQIDESIKNSIKNLNIVPVCIQIHNANKDVLNNEVFLKEIKKIVLDNGIKKFGVTVYDDNLILANNIECIDVIQCEFNLTRSGILNSILNNNKEINVRSVYNKGLLAIKNINELSDNFSNSVKEKIQELIIFCNANNMTLPELALRFALSNKKINNVVLGINTEAEVVSNVEIFKKSNLDEKILEDLKKLNLNNLWKDIDPRTWN